jgi:hypothetical protein
MKTSLCSSSLIVLLREPEEPLEVQKKKKKIEIKNKKIKIRFSRKSHFAGNCVISQVGKYHKNQLDSRVIIGTI